MLTNAGKEWTKEEEKRLAEALREGMTVGLMSVRFRRTKAAIVSRLVRLGYLAQLPGESAYRRVGPVFCTFREIKEP